MPGIGLLIGISLEKQAFPKEILNKSPIPAIFIPGPSNESRPQIASDLLGLSFSFPAIKGLRPIFIPGDIGLI